VCTVRFFLRVYNQEWGRSMLISLNQASGLSSSPTSIMPGSLPELLDTVQGLPRDSSTRILILVRSARDATVAATFLSGMGYPTTTMYGDCPHWLREEAFNDFESGRFPIITSTDVQQLAKVTMIAHHIIHYRY
jgi:superfamily II DNA/RNA helicase